MAQPPLSQAIRRLEHELDARLFNRTSRSVDLTEAGKVLLAEARRILGHTEAAVVATQRTAQGRAGKLSIGFTVPWAYELAPEIVSEFSRRYPDVALSIRELSSSEQVRLLIDDDLDFGFLRLPAHYEAKGVETILLSEDVLSVVLPRTHPLAGAKSLGLGQLKDEPFVLPSYSVGQGMEQFSFRMQVVNLCAEARFVRLCSMMAGVKWLGSIRRSRWPRGNGWSWSGSFMSQRRDCGRSRSRTFMHFGRKCSTAPNRSTS